MVLLYIPVPKCSSVSQFSDFLIRSKKKVLIREQHRYCFVLFCETKMPESKLSVTSDILSSDSSDEDDEVLDIVWDFCRRSDLGDTLEAFVLKHFGELEDLRPLAEEQKHRHIELFEELLKLCEEQITDVLSDSGHTIEEFIEKSREVRKKRKHLNVPRILYQPF